MAGVPVRSLETYVSRLVEKGYKVAIIDQLEDAKQTTGMLRRGLTRIVTAGTITEQEMLEPGKNNYLAALFHDPKSKSEQYGIAFCDLSTGDFRVGSFDLEDKTELLRAYAKFAPVEIIYQDTIDNLGRVFDLVFDNEEVLTPKPSLWFDTKVTDGLLKDQFDVLTLEGFGMKSGSPSINAAGALLRYLKETQFANFPHLQTIRSLEVEGTMVLDAQAIRSLELFENTQDHSSHASLLDLMDETVTPMGGRLLRHWMANPLASKDRIEKRLDAVELFQTDPLLQHRVRSILSEMGDIERLVTRISMRKAKPDELIKLAYGLEQIPDLRSLLTIYTDRFPIDLITNIDPSTDFVTLIRSSIRDNPEGSVGEGKIIREGINQELDRLQAIIAKGESWLDEYLESEMQVTGITSIKVKQNNHLGYFMDIAKKDLDKVPESYARKQVMVNSTRYFTEELKNWETDILEAEIKILELEEAIYNNILTELAKFTSVLQRTSQSLAILDCLANFAYLADRRQYTKPTLTAENTYQIKGGRHPVIEALNPGTDYVPNDLNLDYDNERIVIITGPNFSGKSSYLRAVAIISIMAQMGSYVPAETVELGVIDRIFTRIGASDNLVAGQSTFMLEMIDAANLVNNSTEHSLVIADELGRGTSTYDGLAIAWSIAEYLHKKERSPKTLIATHYHQLSELEEILPAVKNYQFSIRFENDNPIFDHKLISGSSDKSFGVEVAKLSGLPDEVIDRGRMILSLLESKAAEVNPDGEQRFKLSALVLAEDGQSSLDNWFGSSITHVKRERNDPPNPLQGQIITMLASIDPEAITPLEALAVLSELKGLIKDS
jgi:DNA mismatch repair protein MutS